MRKDVFSALAGLALSGCTAAQVLPARDKQPERLLLCSRLSTFELEADEQIVGVLAGGHAMRVTIRAPHGTYAWDESEVLAAEARGARLYTRNRTFVRRLTADQVDGEISYGIFGPVSFYGGQNRLVARLSGDALSGGRRDRAIYRRIEVRNSAGLPCNRTIIYGSVD